MDVTDTAARTVPALRPRHVLLYGELTDRILGAFFEVYGNLGAGFLESVYRRAMALELAARGVTNASEVPIVINYRGECIGRFRADLVAEHRVLIEIKSGEHLPTRTSAMS